MTDAVPTLDDIRATAERIKPYVLETPLVPWVAPGVARRLGASATVLMKLELLQHTGTFKARGAINNALTFAKNGKPK